MTIDNFTLIEFLNQPSELIDKYMTVLRFINPLKTKQEVFHMTMKQVETIKQTIASGDDSDLIKIVSIVEEITEEEVLDLKIVDFFGIVNSIRKQVETIINAESNNVSPERINVKWEMVNGSERMAKFGIYNTLESLSGGDILKYSKIMELPYSEVFTVLVMRKTMIDLQNEMNLIKTE